MGKPEVTGGLLLVIAAGVAGPVQAQDDSVSTPTANVDSHGGAVSSLAVQGGWWNFEVELKTRQGLYVALGAPIPVAAFNDWATHANWTVPFGVRIGYQHETWPRLKLRGALHVAGTYSSESICDCSDERQTRSFLLLEAGLRYEGPSGFVAGIDVPLVAFDDAHELVRGRTSGVETFPPPLSFAFSQLYVGYAWRW
jgi:hypothetical protein